MTVNKEISFRTIIVGAFFCLLYMAIGARAAYLQIFCKSWLPQKALKQYERSYTSIGKRGTIYDRNHREMAVSLDVLSIAARPSEIQDSQKTAKKLAKVLKADSRVLYKELTSQKRFLWVKRHASPKEIDAVKTLALPGLQFISEPRRYYPNTTLGAQVLGFSGMDQHGLEGIEFYYDGNLKGSVASYKVNRDALGRGFLPTLNADENSNGNNLVLTIDQTVQYIAEKAIKEAVEEFEAQSAMTIVMNPSTGAVLAMANYPFFNPNSYQSFGREAWRNRTITDPFEPGSTMKIFIAAAAIESKQCSTDTLFFCEEGKYKVDRNYIHDTHPYGWLSVQQIIKFSSNIGAAKITERIGKESLYKTLYGFGFGSKTGVDCPGETAGSLSSHKKWTNIDASAISFGQGISVSAIQLITAVSAIANNGLLMKPYIVQAIVDENGRLVKSFVPQRVREVVSPAAANAVKEMMASVTTDKGTGVNAAVDGYSVCGKTGTAQKITETGEYSNDKFTSSFVGFVPEENPQIAIIVVVDEPNKAHYGGTVAAPAFKKIAQEALNYFNVTPRETNDLKGSKRLEVSMGNRVIG